MRSKPRFQNNRDRPNRGTRPQSAALIHHAQRFIATVGRLPQDHVLPDAGGHHHAPAANTHIDRAERREEVSEARLAHPVAQAQGITAPHQQGVSLLDHGDPLLFIDAGQRGEFQHSQGLPTQLAHGGGGSSGDELPCRDRSQARVAV